jgi:hypothetical protein
MECITIATDAHGMPLPNVIGALGADEDVTAAPGWALPPQRKRRLSPWEIERSDAELRLAAAVDPQDADAAPAWLLPPVPKVDRPPWDVDHDDDDESVSRYLAA